jgi:DnaD/phage-associated family protein
MTERKFEGVPAGRVQVTPLPNVIFSEVLPAIDDLAEAQVTLHIFFLLYHKKGSPRYVTTAELEADPTLSRALSRNPEPIRETLTRGLQLAEARGTLLHLVVEGEDWYFFNTAESRKAIERIERGELLDDRTVQKAAPAAPPPPNIYRLYEQQIGVLTPLIAEELKEAEKEYPPEVILDAFRIAAENNARKWSYVRAILVSWTREGKHEASGRDHQEPGNRRGKRKPHFQGKFADLVKPRK